jgi:5'-deoxynucleotidase YfbR-like HD superfamily hydrolase
MINSKDAWIQTFTGKKVHPLHLRLSEVDINDIAHSLSLRPRFAGHSCTYNVADHSIRVAELLPQPLKIYGLLHDAAEYLMGDVPSPMKPFYYIKKTKYNGDDEYIPYSTVEKEVLGTIHASLDLDPPDEAAVKAIKVCDVILLVTEARDLMSPLHPEWFHRPENGFSVLAEKIVPLSQLEAETKFLDEFLKLRGIRI